MAQENDLIPSGEAGDAGADVDELSLHDELEQAFEDEVEPTDEARQGGRARDEFGRFAPKAPGEGQERPQGAPQGQGGPAQREAPAEALRAPQSWTPQAREHWGHVPPEVQAEIHRRESEMGRVLQGSAEARQFIDAFSRVVGPYEMFIQAENSNALQAVQNLMSTAAALRVGTNVDKAQLVAQIINRHGVDLQMLDQILAGQQPQGGMAQQQQFRDPRFDQFLAQQQAMLAQNAQREDAEMRQGLNQFAQTHEFYADVAAQMADMVEVLARQGSPIDLERVYMQACLMHPEISPILAKRASPAGGVRDRAVLRAKRAAVSVRSESTPGGATVPRDGSMRAALEAALESHGFEEP
jgi:hypothetical protein